MRDRNGLDRRRDPDRDQRRESGRAARPRPATAAYDARARSDPDSGFNRVSARNAIAADSGRVTGPDTAHPAKSVAWTEGQRELFHALYREHFDFVYRNLRRLGVPTELVDDALQDVYVVVLRHIDGYREGTHARAWLFAIALRVAGNYRRTLQRRGPKVSLRNDEPDLARPDSFELTARARALRIVHMFLERLDDDRRAVFVMAELEQMTVPEIAFALSANVNTVYSRLRSARSEFERMIAELREPHASH
jgi:RNA polymerase sigma-70 factor, ECF subfamily